MELVLAGIERASAPRDVWRAASEMRSASVLDVCAAAPDIAEAMVISDGGRFEAYVVMHGGFDSFEVLADMVASCIGCASSQVMGCLYAAEGFDAALHALHVASGYDTFCATDSSPVEAMRAAYAASVVHGVSGACIKRLVASAVKFGTCSAGLDEQALAQHRAVSALDLAQFVFDDLPKRVVFAVGENRTGEAVCERLEACGATVVRTAARDGTWRESLARADVVLFCDDQEACVFSRTEAKSMRRARRGRMSVVFDLTERGCVDTGCVGFDDIFVYTLADLQGIDGGEDAVRAPSEASVMQHAREEAHEYMRWFDERQSG